MAETVIEAGDLGAKLKSFLAIASERDDCDESGENGDGAEGEDRGDEPGTALGDVVAERFDGNVGVVFALHGVLEHGAKFFFGPAVAKLSANARSEFDGIERKGDNVVGAEIESAGAFESVALDDHDNLRSGLGAGAGVELGDKAAAGKVGRGGFGDEEVRRSGENLIDRKAVLRCELVALAG